MLAIARSFPAPGPHPCGLAWDGSRLWYSDGKHHAIYALDPETGEVTRRLPCPEVRTALDYRAPYLWQVAGHPKEIRGVDPEDGTVVARLPLGDEAERVCGLILEEDTLWVALKEPGLLQRRHRASGRVLAEWPVTPRVAEIVAVGEEIWYVDFEAGLLAGIDPRSGRELGRFAVAGNPTGLCWDGRFFWYADFVGRRICAVDPFAGPRA